MNETIMNKLKQEYNNFVKEYGEDKILWVAVTGQPIFNPDHTNDIPVSACYLPIEDELYLINPDTAFKNNLMDIRYIKYASSDFILTPYKIINPKYEELLVNNLFLNNNIFNNDKELISVIKTIINHSLAVPAKEQELINILTKTEKKILSLLIKDFNDLAEGDVKVSKATIDYNTSTSVFRTLFYKLKEYQVAEVDSRGVKGTHIKFNNIKTLKSLID